MTETIQTVLKKKNKLLFIIGILTSITFAVLNLFIFINYLLCSTLRYDWLSGQPSYCNALPSLIWLSLISLLNIFLISTDIIVIVIGKNNVNIKFWSYAKGNIISYSVILILVTVWLIYFL